MSMEAGIEALEASGAISTRVIFRNRGLIDPLAITTFGLSAKTGPNPIGTFGTGIKHAIAMILRAGEKITIWRGTERLEFGTVERTVRDQTFKMVTMNGEPIGFTLDLGKGWEPWMALRELYCNCIDEKGAAYWSDADWSPLEDETAVVVEGFEFMRLFEERAKYFLETKPLFTFGDVEVHEGESGTIFYRGVAVQKMEKGIHGIFTYNLIGHLELTEDRTLKYAWQPAERVAEAIQKTDRVEFIEECIRAPKSITFEGKIDFIFHATAPNKQFVETVANARALKDGKTINESAVSQAEKHTPAAAKYVACKLREDQRVTWERIRLFLTGIGYDPAKYHFSFYERLAIGVFAESTGRHEIMISRDGFDAGGRKLCLDVLAAILECVKFRAWTSVEMVDVAAEEMLRLGEKFLGDMFAPAPAVEPAMAEHETEF